MNSWIEATPASLAVKRLSRCSRELISPVSHVIDSNVVRKFSTLDKSFDLSKILFELLKPDLYFLSGFVRFGVLRNEFEELDVQFLISLQLNNWLVDVEES